MQENQEGVFIAEHSFGDVCCYNHRDTATGTLLGISFAIMG